LRFCFLFCCCLFLLLFFFGGGEIGRQLLIVVSTLVDIFLGLEIVRTNEKFTSISERNVQIIEPSSDLTNGIS